MRVISEGIRQDFTAAPPADARAAQRAPAGTAGRSPGQFRVKAADIARADPRASPGRLKADWRPAKPMQSPAQADGRLTTQRAFHERPPASTSAFRQMLAAEGHAYGKHGEHKQRIAGDAALAAAERRLKHPEAAGGNPVQAADYLSLRGPRKNESLMEKFLPAGSPFRSKLYAPTGGVRDTGTGLYAELRKLASGPPVAYVLCFPGTGVAGNKDTQWRTNIAQLLGDRPPALHLQAQALAQDLKTSLEAMGCTLSVAGHSLGGGLANFVGLGLGIDSYCFNAAALGGGSLAYLRDQGRLTPERVGRQVHLRVKADFASDSTLGTRIGRLRPGMPRPCQVGQVFQLNPGDAAYPAGKPWIERHFLSAFNQAIPLAPPARTRAPDAAPPA